MFLYIEQTVQGFRNAHNNVGQKFKIDVQNSAPPFDEKQVYAWLFAEGKMIAFKNGGPLAIVRIIYDDILAHMNYVTREHSFAECAPPAKKMTTGNKKFLIELIQKETFPRRSVRLLSH